MNKIFSEKYVAAISILWIVIMACLVILKRSTLDTLGLNEIGDALAGAFAPLGFFWLVAGFYQQGTGLKQNSEALKLQAKELQESTKALNLQVAELKITAEGQQELLKLTNEERLQKHFECEPGITTFLSEYTHTKEDRPIYEHDNFVEIDTIDIGKFTLTVKSECNTGRNVKIIDRMNKSVLDSKFKLEENNFIQYEFEHYPAQLKEILEGKRKIHKVLIEYSDIYGKEYKLEFEVVVSLNAYREIEVYKRY